MRQRRVERPFALQQMRFHRMRVGDAGIDPNAWSWPDNSPALHIAADIGDLDMIKALAAKGAKLDYMNTDGVTALELVEKKLEGAGRGVAEGVLGVELRVLREVADAGAARERHRAVVGLPDARHQLHQIGRASCRERV